MVPLQLHFTTLCDGLCTYQIGRFQLHGYLFPYQSRCVALDYAFRVQYSWQRMRRLSDGHFLSLLCDQSSRANCRSKRTSLPRCWTRIPPCHDQSSEEHRMLRELLLCDVLFAMRHWHLAAIEYGHALLDGLSLHQLLLVPQPGPLPLPLDRQRLRGVLCLAVRCVLSGVVVVRVGALRHVLHVSVVHRLGHDHLERGQNPGQHRPPSTQRYVFASSCE